MTDPNTYIAEVEAERDVILALFARCPAAANVDRWEDLREFGHQLNQCWISRLQRRAALREAKRKFKE